MPIRVVRGLFGFAIEDEQGRRVSVDLEPWTFAIRAPRRAATIVGLPPAKDLADLLCNGFPGRRQRKGDPPPAPADPPGPTPELTREIAVETERLFARAPREVREVHAAVHAAAGVSTGIHRSPRFYRRPYLVRDVLVLRAAAIAVGHAGELRRGSATDDVDAALDELEHWPGLFSPSGTAYGSLRRTLAKLPAEVPSGLVCELRRVELPRPVVNPLELSAICLASRISLPPGAGELRRILLDARAEEIARAVERVGAALREPLRPDLTENLKRVLFFLADYPDPHAGRLGGLVVKAIAWHRSWERRTLGEALAKAGYQALAGNIEEPTRPPPFPLPELPGVRFLATVEDIARESVEMNHCVASRAYAALGGRCFLFHVEHEGAKATVQLSSGGEVVEASGPSNRSNAAVEWGRDALEAWWSAADEERRIRRAASPRSNSRTQESLEASALEWQHVVRRLRSRAGPDPEWLLLLERFWSRMQADQQAAGGAAPARPLP